MAKAIEQVATDDTDAGQTGYSLAMPDPDGAGYVATLLPIEAGRRQSIMAPFAASIAVFAQNPAQMSVVPGEAFARLYSLTGGELRVLLAVAQGLGAKEAADMLGIGEPTVRTHLRMLARLARALADEGFRSAIARRARLDELVREAERLEAAPTTPLEETE